MSDFHDLQANIQEGRKAHQAQQKTVFLSRQQLNKLLREKSQVFRSHGRDSQRYQSLLAQEESLIGEISSQEAGLAQISAEELRLLEAFERFSDPRTHISQHSDQFPILLFPVRLETRFKRIDRDGGGRQHQLWVRIFPDDCSIDTFDDTLTETEVKQARNYWTHVWKAGEAGDIALEPFVRDRVIGAWRELMGLFNPGRAYWIIENYTPENPDDIPTRNSESERILVIPTEDPPEGIIRDALRVYWRAVFLANGDLNQTTAAFDALAATPGVGEEAARQLIEDYPPQNLEPGMEDPQNPPDVQVVFLEFLKLEDTHTKLTAWSQAAKVRTFPEKFVLLGYQAGNPEPVIQELGRRITDPLVVGPDPGADINQVLKAVYGDEFDTFSDDEKAEKYIQYLSEEADTKWLFDFDEAIQAGMGFKVDISDALYEGGFEHLFVLGVKLSADEAEGQALLEQLIRNHHFGDSGFSILPQGAATNNTADSKSDHSVTEDANESYARYFDDLNPEDPTEATQKLDGRRLAELLGIDSAEATLLKVAGYYHKDQREARAMNTALWNATLGYYMESMLTPVFTDQQRSLTRWFFLNYVSGRGRVPAVRIGDQPYGILPVTTITDLGWLERDDTRRERILSDIPPFLRGLHAVLLELKSAWEESLDSVAYVGKEDDAHKTLLEILGLHATSVEFDQRYAESFQHVFNKLIAQGFFGEALAALLAWAYKAQGMQLLADLGYDHDEELDPKIPILEKFFLTEEINVTKPVVDDRKLSEVEPIRAYTEDGLNYIEWLIDNAAENHQNIREQKGFSEGKPPYALLYDFLRHSLNLEFGNAGLNYYLNAEILNAEQVATARVDADFIGFQEQTAQLESKWDLIYRSDNRLTDPGVMLVDHISNQIKFDIVNAQTRQLHEVIEALKLIQHTPTARLERAFVEHLDCCTYRLDAWLLGFVNLQLDLMRYEGRTRGEEIQSRRGIYLGAYGWLENLKPEDKTLKTIDFPEGLGEIFDPDGDKTPVTDDTNAGYVHAPSVNHAITAAVLRNAYTSNASEEQAEPYKVNLSSERVRMALSMIEGIQQGQSLGALLGYQLERGLHDRTDLNLDIYIYELRKVFPFRSNNMLSTLIKTGRIAETLFEEQRFEEELLEFEEDKAITKIEARNVINGLTLLQHIKRTKNPNYPFGFPIGEGIDKLKVATDEQAEAIDAEVERIMNIRDAVADLAMAESVHQVVQGNYDRAAGALDTYSKGSYPQMPDVARSSTSGVSLTHRFGIHLPAEAVPSSDATPRASAEPAVSEWLAELFPTDLGTINCEVEYRVPDYEIGDAISTVNKTVTLEQLGLLPVDLLYMLDVESDKSLTALDDHILRFVHTDDNPRPDIELEIHYTHTFDDRISFFELATMIESLRSLVVSSRPLIPEDIALQEEASEGLTSTITIDASRIQSAKTDIADLISDVQTDVVDVIDVLIDVEDFTVTLSNKAAIIAQIDPLAEVFVDHLHQLSLYGIPQAGFGFIYERTRAIYSALMQKVVAYKKRWLEKQDRYDDLIDNQLTAETDVSEQILILKEAERTISTQASMPPPAVPDYLAILAAKRSAFDQKLDSVQGILDGNFLSLAALVDAIDLVKAGDAATPGLDVFDVDGLDIEEAERQILVLAEDLHAQASKLVEVLEAKVAAVQALIDEAAASSSAKEVVKLLTEAARDIFGEDFQIVPVFALNETHGNELQKCLDDQGQLLDYQINVLSNDFPVDDWLYGTARVREKLGAWENLVMLAEGFKQQTLDLTPIQLPYAEEDHWLGLEYPETHQLESDKLLYTTYLPNFDKTGLQCGLLVDEWTEVIPAKTETTGMTFHYDRPNSEPPQTMLLVTPSDFTGGWQWTDLVDTLKETLDLAKLRAVEPDHIDKTDYAQFLPATVTAVTTNPFITMAVNIAMGSDQVFIGSGEDE